MMGETVVLLRAFALKIQMCVCVALWFVLLLREFDLLLAPACSLHPSSARPPIGPSFAYFFERKFHIIMSRKATALAKCRAPSHARHLLRRYVVS